MSQIADIIEEKTKEALNYDKKSSSTRRKLYEKLFSACITNNIKMKCIGKGGRIISKVRLFLYNSNESNGEYYWARPIIVNNMLHFDFGNGYPLINASNVDCFDQTIHRVV